VLKKDETVKTLVHRSSEPKKTYENMPQNPFGLIGEAIKPIKKMPRKTKNTNFKVTEIPTGLRKRLKSVDYFNLEPKNVFTNHKVSKLSL
jgi:hypothetical protein